MFYVGSKLWRTAALMLALINRISVEPEVQAIACCSMMLLPSDGVGRITSMNCRVFLVVKEYTSSLSLRAIFPYDGIVEV